MPIHTSVKQIEPQSKLSH